MTRYVSQSRTERRAAVHATPMIGASPDAVSAAARLYAARARRAAQLADPYCCGGAPSSAAVAVLAYGTCASSTVPDAPGTFRRSLMACTRYLQLAAACALR